MGSPQSERPRGCGGRQSWAVIVIDRREENHRKARGKWKKLKIGDCSTNVISSFHPAFLMRQPEQKKYAWIDLKMIRSKISELKIKID